MLSVERSSKDDSQPKLLPTETILMDLTGCLCAVYLDVSEDSDNDNELDENEMLDDTDKDKQSLSAKPAYTFQCNVFVTTRRLLILDDSPTSSSSENPSDNTLGLDHTSVAFHGLSMEKRPPSLFVSLDDCFVSSLEIIPMGADVEQTLQDMYEAMNEGQFLNPPSDLSDNDKDEDQDREALLREDMEELDAAFGDGVMLTQDQLSGSNEELASMLAQMRIAQQMSEDDVGGGLLHQQQQKLQPCLDLSQLDNEEDISGALMSGGMVISDELSEEQRREIMAHLESVMTVTDTLPDDSQIVSEMLNDEDDEQQQAGNVDSYYADGAEELDDERYFEDGYRDVQPEQQDENKDDFETSDAWKSNVKSLKVCWCCDTTFIRDLQEHSGQFQLLEPSRDPTYEMFRMMY